MSDADVDEEETFQVIFEHNGFVYHVVDMPKGIPFRPVRWGSIDWLMDFEGIVFGILLLILYAPFELFSPVKVAVIRYRPRWFSKIEVVYKEQHPARADVTERQMQLSEIMVNGVFNPEVFFASRPADLKWVKQMSNSEDTPAVEQTDWSVERGGLRFEVAESAMGFPLNFAGMRQRGSTSGSQRLLYRLSFRVLSKFLPTKIGVIQTDLGKRSWPLAVFKEHQPPRADTTARRLELLQMVQRGDFDLRA